MVYKWLAEKIQQSRCWKNLSELSRLSLEKRNVIGEVLLEYGKVVEIPLESEFCYFLGLPSILLPKIVTPEYWLRWKDIQFVKLFQKAISLPQKKNVAMLQDYIRRFNLPYLVWMEELGAMFTQKYKLKRKEDLSDKMVLVIKKEIEKEEKAKISGNGHGKEELSEPQECLMKFKREGDSWVVEK